MLGSFTAFTLIELLVVIAVIGLLAGILLPTLGRAKQLGLSAACMNNLRQLQICFREYTDENGHFPSNNLVALLGYGTILGSSWAPGDLNSDSAIDSLEYGAFFPYNESLGIYRCPADKSLSSSGAGSERRVPSVHSYNMSIWFNCIAEPYGYVSDSEIEGCGKPTSDIFVFIDTDPRSIVDPAFGIYPSKRDFRMNLWVDLPSDRHSQGANVSFLDGHVEHRSWKAPKVWESQPQMYNKEGGDEMDLRWLQDKIPPKLARSFWDQMLTR